MFPPLAARLIISLVTVVIGSHWRMFAERDSAAERLASPERIACWFAPRRLDGNHRRRCLGAGPRRPMRCLRCWGTRCRPEAVNEDEVRSYRERPRPGFFYAKEGEIVDRVFGLGPEGQEPAVPRSEIVWIESTDGWKVRDRRDQPSLHFPVCRGLDNLIGAVHVKDL